MHNARRTPERLGSGARRDFPPVEQATQGRMKPTPRRDGAKWVVDLRFAGFGQRYQVGDAALPEAEAIHLAYACLNRLREEARLRPSIQLGLDLAGAGQLFGRAVGAWLAEKDFKSVGGENWVRQYATHVAAELGAYRLADLLPPEGSRILRGYRDAAVAAKRAPNTVAGRLSIVGQVLNYCAEQGWMTDVPRIPARPPRRPPLFLWITEAHFRALRASILAEPNCRRAAGRLTPDEWMIYVERRRCYLSWLFYTGCHTADADNATSDFVSLDMGVFRRRNSKSARCVPDEHFELPEPLSDDLRALQAMFGRPFYIDEPIFGGAWPTVAKAIRRAAVRLKFGKVNPRILRRSCIRELCLRGYTEQETADRVGHVDTRMIHEVYLRNPRPLGSARSRWQRTPPAPGKLPGQVVQFPGTKPAKEGKQ